jgi:hypothetical protein
MPKESSKEIEQTSLKLDLNKASIKNGLPFSLKKLLYQLLLLFFSFFFSQDIIFFVHRYAHEMKKSESANQMIEVGTDFC